MKRLLIGVAVSALALCSNHSVYELSAAPRDPYLMTIARTGKVLHSPMLKAIFWGAEWHDPAFAADIVLGLDTLLAGYSGSAYAATLREYYDRSGSISGYTTYTGYTIDSSPAPAPEGFSGAMAIAKVCSITNNNPDSNAAYFLFTSTPKASDAPGNTCALHAWGACSNVKQVQAIGVRYSSGQIGSGCDGVQDYETGHSLALAQMANLAMHELAETITDPRNTGWHDSYGEEISNKCIRTFPADASKYPVFPDGSVWKLQGLWSNAAYGTGTGAPNLSGHRACLWE